MAQVACPRRPNTRKVMLEDESDLGYAALTMAMSCWEPGIKILGNSRPMRFRIPEAKLEDPTLVYLPSESKNSKAAKNKKIQVQCRCSFKCSK